MSKDINNQAEKPIPTIGMLHEMSNINYISDLEHVMESMYMLQHGIPVTESKANRDAKRQSVYEKLADFMETYYAYDVADTSDSTSTNMGEQITEALHGENKQQTLDRWEKGDYTVAWNHLIKLYEDEGEEVDGLLDKWSTKCNRIQRTSQMVANLEDNTQEYEAEY